MHAQALGRPAWQNMRRCCLHAAKRCSNACEQRSELPECPGQLSRESGFPHGSGAARDQADRRTTPGSPWGKPPVQRRLLLPYGPSVRGETGIPASMVPRIIQRECCQFQIVQFSYRCLAPVFLPTWGSESTEIRAVLLAFWGKWYFEAPDAADRNLQEDPRPTGFSQTRQRPSIPESG